jgi:hypothetical protein
MCDRGGAGAPGARHPSARECGACLTGWGRSSASEQEIEELAEQRGEAELIGAYGRSRGRYRWPCPVGRATVGS